MALTYPDQTTERITKALAKMWDNAEYRDTRLFPELVRRLDQRNTEPEFDAYREAEWLVMSQWCDDFATEWHKND